MKKTVTLLFVTIVLAVSACAPRATTVPPTQPPTNEPVLATETAAPVATSLPEATDLPAATDSAPAQKQYTNAAFKFGFQYPANWFGPDEYVSENTLRLAVGSDVVYPYGEMPETPSDVKNSYLVVIQYTKDNQGTYANDAVYQALLKLQDGEGYTEGRSLYTRVRQVQVGRFEGLEYISTNSATAQTEHFYMREIVLMDQQTNDLITILAQPNNVEVTDPAKWLDVYKSIDEANVSVLHQLVESITAE